MNSRSPAGVAAVGGVLGVLLGLALGAVVAGPGPEPTPAAPVPSVEPARASDACLALADEAERIADLGEEAAQAMEQLDARRLEDVVEQMGEADRTVRASLADCRGGQDATSPPTVPTP